MIVMFFVPLYVAYVGLSDVKDEYYDVPEPQVVEIVADANSNLEGSGGLVQVVELPKKPKFTFLSDQDDIFISFNMGNFPDLIYMISVQTDGTYSAEFSESQLASLEYELIPISTCAVRITGPDFDSVVLCRSQKQQRNAIERAVSTSRD
jgi:hypothetical protein